MVIVVGKGELLAFDENWNALIDGCKKNNTYLSTFEDKWNLMKNVKISWWYLCLEALILYINTL